MPRRAGLEKERGATQRAVWRSRAYSHNACSVASRVVERAQEHRLRRDSPRRAENTKSIGNDATARERREEVDGAISTRAEERKVNNWQRLVSVLFGQVLKTPLNLEAAERCGTHSDQRQRR